MYGYAKIPGIYSKVPPYDLYISDNVTGLLVENDKRAWVDAMTRLVKDKALRKKISDNAYEDIVHNYQTAEQASTYMECVLS